MQEREVVFGHPVRTAIGTYNGTLKATPATELGAAVVRETLRRSRLDPARIGSVVMGNVIQAEPNESGPASCNQRRESRRRASADSESGLRLRRAGDRLGRAGDLAWVQRRRHRGRHGEHGSGALSDGWWPLGYRMEDAQIYDSMLRDGLNDAFSGEHSGWHTEDLVARAQITREDQDRWAERSQQRFAAAQKAGRFAAGIVGVEVKGRKGAQVFDTDEANRPETTLEVLSKLKPAFRKDGTITAAQRRPSRFPQELAMNSRIS